MRCKTINTMQSQFCISYFGIRNHDRAKGSSTLLASFIFSARYGEPPRSGWFANITVLYLSASFCLEIFRSLLSMSAAARDYLMATISAASLRVIFASKPPFGRDLNPRGAFGIAWNRCAARIPTFPWSAIRRGNEAKLQLWGEHTTRNAPATVAPPIKIMSGVACGS